MVPARSPPGPGTRPTTAREAASEETSEALPQFASPIHALALKTHAVGGSLRAPAARCAFRVLQRPECLIRVREDTHASRVHTDGSCAKYEGFFGSHPLTDGTSLSVHPTLKCKGRASSAPGHILGFRVSVQCSSLIAQSSIDAHFLQYASTRLSSLLLPSYCRLHLAHRLDRQRARASLRSRCNLDWHHSVLSCFCISRPASLAAFHPDLLLH